MARLDGKGRNTGRNTGWTTGSSDANAKTRVRPGQNAGRYNTRLKMGA
jgi:hypothetical protein